MHTPAPSLDLYQRVRAGFVRQGTTLKQWCRQNGTHLSNVKNSVVGSWNGPRGQEMRRRVVKAARLEDIK